MINQYPTPEDLELIKKNLRNTPLVESVVHEIKESYAKLNIPVGNDFIRKSIEQAWINAFVSAEEPTRLPVRDATTSAVVALTETLPYFELAGHRLEKQNHGAPECPDIAINEKRASWTKPQAFSKEIDGQECWFYNYPGACAEAKFLGKEVPTINGWMEMLASVPGNAEEKAQALNIPLAGYRNASSGRFGNAGDCAFLASSSPEGDEDAYYAVLERGYAYAFRDWYSCRHGMSLRFFFG